MTNPPPADIDVAPISRRFVAGLVDAGLTLATLGGIGVIGWKLRHRLRRFTEPIWQRLRPYTQELADRGNLTRSQKVFIGLVLLIVAVSERNLKSPGGRVMGLRKVELPDGQPISIRAALIQFAAASVQAAVLDRLFKPLERRHRQPLEALKVELSQLRKEHQDDPAALQQATMQLYRDRGVSPFRSCAWTLPRMIVAQTPRTWSPYRLGLSDQLARTVIVFDPPRSRHRSSAKRLRSTQSGRRRRSAAPSPSAP